MSAEPSVSHPSPPLATRSRLRYWIVVVGTVLLVAFAASSASDAWRSYRQSSAATERELANLAKALAEQAAHSLQTIDVLLRDTAEWYTTLGDRATPQDVHYALVGRAAGLPQVRALNIVDAQGIRRHTSLGPSDTAGLDVSDRSYFVAHRDAAATGLFVS